MMVVIFEVETKPGRSGDYFALAQALRAELERVPGFVSVERFQHVTAPEKFVSISTWRDAAAVTAWREHAEHRAAQTRGKADIFADFRIRVTEVVRDYSMADRTG